ncbi:alpha/beta hydrolase [Nakamurella flavida]|uniref:Alpha/beta hydrolase n=1 Tax=Nakamurella flavida TaxID=363630 RepID=A0A938YPQ5_9ACTN|nr:alpha/beta hydrolase [Nakamurella flavida]MBM9475904.1 alpha/beta hydrolase [Nakamurella flavida]MBM9478436.1 alpha/beta hydrolase [Nakamurella flavida]MDP9777810.1 pimeloyl-ACP methyl ester carboxylesterase [Nakamurella flavida]
MANPLVRVLGAVGIAGGVVGAAALGGVTAQRRAVRRYRQSSMDGEADGYGSLAADRTYSVAADDGVVLAVEEVGPVDAPLTVVFAHGWTLRAGSWHFQRYALAHPVGDDTGPAVRLVFYDQRSHGRSTRAEAGHSTMADLAGDLAQVLATAAPDGPVVIVGHSMGGMALLTLAGRDPGYFTHRVAGIGLISTSATALRQAELSRLLVAGSTSIVKLISATVARYPTLIERSRAGSRDAAWLLTRALGFARRDIPAALVDYLDEMISGTPVDVIADFTPALLGLDALAALPALAELPALVACGDADRLTPVRRSEALAAALPDSELVVVPGAGHMAIMEAPEPIDEGLDRLIIRAARRAGLVAPDARPDPARTRTVPVERVRVPVDPTAVDHAPVDRAVSDEEHR